jgi:hypothetical protein
MIASRTLIQQHVPGDAKARSRWARTNAASSKFYYTRVRLLNAALPADLVNITANTALKGVPLVIDANTSKLGKTGSFVPKCVIIAGAQVRKTALNGGSSYAMAWVGENALKDMNVFASDGISSDELTQKLAAALQTKFRKGGTNDSNSYSFSGPYPRMVYPFDNYLIFQMEGQDYRQDYTIDTASREVHLSGTPQKVEQEFVDVDGCGGLEPFDYRSKAPNIPTGLRANPTMTLPSLFTVNLGAINSELRNPLFGEPFLNVDKVVAAYLSDIKTGTHKAVIPWGTPMPATRMLFAGELRARGVQSPADFFLWAEANKSKKVSNDPVGMEDFAHVGNPKDKASWKLPIHDKKHVRNAMVKFDQTELPSGAKTKAAHKIVKRAKSMGVDTSNFEKEFIPKMETAAFPKSQAREKGGITAAGEPTDDEQRIADKSKSAMSQNKLHVGHAAGVIEHLLKSPKHDQSNDYNRGDLVKHETAARHFSKAVTAYNAGNEAEGDAHVAKGNHIASQPVKTWNSWSQASPIYAGGPGSGPRPKGGEQKNNLAVKLSDAKLSQATHEDNAKFYKEQRGAGKNKALNLTLENRSRDVAHHYANAVNAYLDGREKDGDAHMAKGRTTAFARVKAGGPGSGPHPGDGSTPKSNDAYDDGRHPADAPVKRGPEGFGDGQTDMFGFKHDDAARDAVVNEFKKNGFTENELDPALKEHGLRSLSKESQGQTATVRADGRFEHQAQASTSPVPWARDVVNKGKGAADVQTLAARKMFASHKRGKSLRQKLLPIRKPK